VKRYLSLQISFCILRNSVGGMHPANDCLSPTVPPNDSIYRTPYLFKYHCKQAQQQVSLAPATKSQKKSHRLVMGSYDQPDAGL
jgi:hypothetical protein